MSVPVDQWRHGVSYDTKRLAREDNAPTRSQEITRSVMICAQSRTEW